MNLINSLVERGVVALVPRIDPGVTPQNNLPFVAFLVKVAGNIQYVGIVVVVVMLVISVVAWAVGQSQGNPNMSSTGKIGVIVSIVAAVIVGSANGLVAWGSTQNIGL